MSTPTASIVMSPRSASLRKTFMARRVRVWSSIQFRGQILMLGHATCVWCVILGLSAITPGKVLAAEKSIVASGSVAAKAGLKQPRQTGPQPLLKHPPEMTPQRRAAICAGECERLNRPLYIVPEAKETPRFGRGKPGRQIQIRGFAAGGSTVQTPAAPGDLRLADKQREPHDSGYQPSIDWYNQ